MLDVNFFCCFQESFVWIEIPILRRSSRAICCVFEGIPNPIEMGGCAKLAEKLNGHPRRFK